MENKELLFNLIKKLESGEIVLTNEDVRYSATEELWLEDKTSEQRVYIGSVIAQGKEDRDWVELNGYEENKNQKFKENFYKQKGLNKCWTKNCSNKIFQKAGDYKKIKLTCQEKHARLVCLSCAEMNAIENLAQGEKD